MKLSKRDMKAMLAVLEGDDIGADIASILEDLQTRLVAELGRSGTKRLKVRRYDQFYYHCAQCAEEATYDGTQLGADTRAQRDGWRMLYRSDVTIAEMMSKGALPTWHCPKCAARRTAIAEPTEPIK